MSINDKPLINSNVIVEIERSILSTFMFDYIFFENNHERLKTSDFYSMKHQRIYEKMTELIKEGLPLDENFLAKKGVIKSDIVEIMTTSPISNASTYIDEIIEESKKREISTQLNILRAKSNLNSTELLQEIEKTFTGNSQLNNSLNFLNISNTSKIKAEKPEFYLEDECPIQKREINLFSSHGGGGKSFTLLYLLLKLAKENKVFGFFSEDSLGITKNRIQILRATHPNLIYDIDMIGKDQPLKPFIEFDKSRNLKPTKFFFLFKKVMKPYDIICIDPLIAIAGDDENSNSQAKFLMALLNEWIEKENKTMLVIHHHSKAGESRGASALIDAVRIHYIVTKKENNDTDRLLKLVKTNHYTGGSEFRVQLFKENYGHHQEQQQTKSEKSPVKRSLWEVI